MPNGDGEGQARAERYRAQFARHDRAVQRAMDGYNNSRELPPYRDREDSEITVNKEGVKVRSAFPRIARIAIGFGLGFLFCAIGVAIVLHFAR